MLNSTGIKTTSVFGGNQILANVADQQSVGCIVASSLGVSVGSRKIVKAGTPITIDLAERSTPAVLANGSTALNAVLLHDVDVTDGNNNGTALVSGFVNLNRLESDVLALVETARANASASKLVVFMKA